MTRIGTWNYIYLPETDSTNLHAKRLALDGVRENTLIRAETQTAGRGRMTRKWESPAGTGIWMTQLFFPENIPAMASGGAVFLSAVALCECLRSMTGGDFLIKWPNDIVINGKKICGMLAECGMSGMRCDWIALGSGINLTRRALPDDLIYASGIYEETGKTLAPEEILPKYLEIFDSLRAQWEKEGLYPIIEKMRPLSATLNKEVRINGDHAFALDIAPDGELVVRTDSGEIKTVVAGDVSVRGITDYV